MSARSVVCPACRATPPAMLLEPSPAGLHCPRCRTRYPVTVAPIVAHPLAPFVRAVASAHGGPDESTLRALAPHLLDDDPLARRLQRVSVAARSHFGDRFETPEEGTWAALKPFLASLPNGRLLELGCGAGRVALELATPGRHVVALDTDPAVLSLGVQVRDAGRAETSVRVIGATYRPMSIRAPELRGRDVEFVLADALNPPFEAASFDAVIALNVLDNVRVPGTLVGQIDALLKPGGVALLATPYAWDSQHVDDGERIGGALGRPFGGDPVEELRGLLLGDGLEVPWRFEIIREEKHLSWTLVRDERCRFVYDLHVVLARKVLG